MKTKPCAMELHPGYAVDCDCGAELLVRLIDKTTPTLVQCNQCKLQYADEVIEEYSQVWWFDCDNCGLEIIVDLDFDDDLGGWLIPDLIVCPECDCHYWTESVDGKAEGHSK